jgi:hypothetical protein
MRLASRLRRAAFVPAIGLAIILAVPLQAAALSHLRGAWTGVSALPDDATINAVVGGNDGLLYVFGVCNDFCIQSNGIVHGGATVTYIYDPQYQLWMSGHGAPTVCDGADAAAVGADGRIRLGGCWSDIVTDPGFRFAIYDTVTNHWTLQTTYGPYVDPIVAMRNGAGRVLWYSNTLHNDGSAVFVSGHRIVAKISGVWHRYVKEPAGGPSDGAAIGSDGRVYVAGGDRNCFPQFGTCSVPKVAAWSPSTNTWTRPTSLPTPRIRVAVTADDHGQIWVVGGMSGDGSQVYDTVEIYVPASGTWRSARRLPAPRFEALATSTPDGRVWVIGGYDANGNPLEDGYVFGSR